MIGILFIRFSPAVDFNFLMKKMFTVPDFSRKLKFQALTSSLFIFYLVF